MSSTTAKVNSNINITGIKSAEASAGSSSSADGLLFPSYATRMSKKAGKLTDPKPVTYNVLNVSGTCS